MELEMSGQAKQKRIEQLEKQHRDDLTSALSTRGSHTAAWSVSSRLIEDLKSELAAVRSNYSSVLNDLDAEKARSEELSVELLNLVNAKNALVRLRFGVRCSVAVFARILALARALALALLLSWL
eukprot:1238174-Rhodomonas_salina.1